MSSKQRRTLCPEGRPEVVAPWIERGGRNADGSTWHTCPCGFTHTRPAPFFGAVHRGVHR